MPPIRAADPYQRRYLSEGSMALIDTEPNEPKPTEITKEAATTKLIAS